MATYTSKRLLDISARAVTMNFAEKYLQGTWRPFPNWLASTKLRFKRAMKPSQQPACSHPASAMASIHTVNM